MEEISDRAFQALDFHSVPESFAQPGHQLDVHRTVGESSCYQISQAKGEVMGKLTGKVAVVTGASKGIGAAIAARLGSEGANVVVNYATDKAGAEKVVKAVESKGGKAVAVQADVSKRDQVKKLFREARNAFGALDVLVNNAGV